MGQQELIPINNLLNWPSDFTETDILRMLLSFVPTSKPDSAKMRLELLQFFWKLRLKVLFSTIDNPLTQWFSGFKNPFTFYPVTSNMPMELLVFDKSILWEVDQMKEVKHNRLKDETQALLRLTSEEDIIIKPANKRGAIVIMDRQDYETK